MIQLSSYRRFRYMRKYLLGRAVIVCIIWFDHALLYDLLLTLLGKMIPWNVQWNWLIASTVLQLLPFSEVRTLSYKSSCSVPNPLGPLWMYEKACSFYNNTMFFILNEFNTVSCVSSYRIMFKVMGLCLCFFLSAFSPCSVEQESSEKNR